jgi:hypothetical protein
MALVSKTTITGDDKHPEPKDYTLTLKIHLTKYDGNGLHPALGAMLNHVLHDWRDGRHPFFVEQMHVGLEAVFRNAVYAAIQRDCQEVYKDEPMVQLSETHQQSRWSFEADKLMKEFDMPHIRDNWEASIERDFTEAEQQAFRDAITKSNTELAS